ncbi:hypothetical protein [Campylobacter sp. 2014D-0216]|uniref:hypothetical protein n=1 Tax=Campylobacter sp. 2014D-0216 TaxID=1813595 RepID=UPI0018A443C9|nr:hypothetical protein [Campylobacter sp. 2014D-0216]QOR00936.1 hypothetical protein A0083_06730 [Campylobacter sp. 2014D-0216]
MLKNSFFLLVFALFFNACTGSMQSFVQTSNEGIFLQARKNQSFSLHINNPSKLNTKLETKLKQKLQNLGLVFNNNQSDYQIYVNIVDFKKFSYAQRLRASSARFFFNSFDKIDDVFEMEVENYYLMQVNLQIISPNSTQSTSLLARTAYLGNINRAKESLEEKIISQIASFFYLQ